MKQVQAGYKVQPLSAFLGLPAPRAAPAIDFLKPLTPETQKTSLEFFNIVNFGLPSNILEGSGFGIISRTAGTSRQIQFSLKVIY